MTAAQAGMTWCLGGMAAAELIALAGLRLARAVVRRRNGRLLRELRAAVDAA